MCEDSGGLVRPDKKRSQDKIDGLVSLIMAIGESMSEPVEEKPMDGGTVYYLKGGLWG